MKGHFYFWWWSLIYWLRPSLVWLFIWCWCQAAVAFEYSPWYDFQECINGKSKQNIKSPTKVCYIHFSWFDHESRFVAANFRKPCTSINVGAIVFVVVGCPVLVFLCGTFSVLHECSRWVTWSKNNLQQYTHTHTIRKTCKKQSETDSEAEINPVSQQTLMEERCRVPQRSSPDR